MKNDKDFLLKKSLSKKDRYNSIINDLDFLFKNTDDNNLLDFKTILHTLSQSYSTSEEELLRNGFRRAYRQLVEGI